MRIGGDSPRYELVPVPPVAAPAPAPAPAPGVPVSAATQPFQQVLHGLGSAVDRGEALVARASRGGLGELDSAQLIALQAGIYRYSEAVDLAAKLVDRATGAIRTVLSPH